MSIFRKEIKIFLSTWLAYAFSASFMVLAGLFFLQLLMRYQDLSLQYLQMKMGSYLEHMNLMDLVLTPFYSQIAVLIIFFSPLLTMRLFSEEKQQNTLELLFSLPVSMRSIVASKYFAMVLSWTILLGALLMYPLLLEWFGVSDQGQLVIDWLSIVSVYIGLILFMASCIAIGMIWSTVSANQLICGIGAFLTLVLLWTMGGAGDQATIMGKIFTYTNITAHLEPFLRGKIRLQDIGYYVSIICFSLFTAIQILQIKRDRA